MRRAFTLIEIIVVVAILAIMATAAVVGVRSGQDAARVKGATRDIMAAIRHARSMALVMMQPAIITYSTERDGDDVCAKITVDGAKLMSSGSSDTVQTLSGEIVHRDGSKVEDAKKPAVGEDEPKELLGDSGGDSVEDVLFAPISSEVVRGVRIKVLTGDELAETTQAPGAREPRVGGEREMRPSPRPGLSRRKKSRVWALHQHRPVRCREGRFGRKGLTACEADSHCLKFFSPR